MENSGQEHVIGAAFESRPACNKQCFEYDKSSHSRRSIDWRDSGIVIDEDHQLFNSFDNICHLDSQSSIWSDCTCHKSDSQNTQEVTNDGNPAQKLIFEQDDDGDTILHLAVVGFTPARVKDLISVCDLNAINNMMQTSLHVAVLANRPEMVQLLVQADARLDVHDRRGNTPLHIACQKGLLEIVDILLSAVPSSLENVDTLTLERFLGTCNFDGHTCLHLAAMNSKKSTIELIVRKYHVKPIAKDSKSGETILHMAIRQFDIELVEFLLELDEHFNVTDYSGRDPLKTIEVLQDSRSTELNQRIKLSKIKRLIEDKIKDCASKGGCCVTRQLGSHNHTYSSCSSSDLSDSDYEMN